MSEKLNAKRKPVILVICKFYLPGYKAGGGLRTVVNMIERFRDRFDFKVITQDHDDDNIQYDSVRIDEWNDIDGTPVIYLSKKNIKLSRLRELIQSIKPDAIYLNSVFSFFTVYALTLRKLKLLPRVNFIVAPEGELSEGALQLKAQKKKFYTNFARRTRLYTNLIWKTTAEPEKLETENFKGSGGEIFIAPNMPSKFMLKNYEQSRKPRKEIGAARMIFLSRYMRKKNFGWLIQNLKNIEGRLEIDIFGPMEDIVYWNETAPTIENFPDNIQIKYQGAIPHEMVLEKLFEYQFFILPTLGENFGHVFIEALAAGCPLITSDRTPWLNLEDKKIGWDISLEKPDEWMKVINRCIEMDDAAYSKLSIEARNFACRWLASPEIEENTLNVLNHALKSDVLGEQSKIVKARH